MVIENPPRCAPQTTANASAEADERLKPTSA